MREESIKRRSATFASRVMTLRRTTQKERNGLKRKGFLSIQTIRRTEKFLYMGNKMKTRIEGIETYILILDIGCHVDLEGPKLRMYRPNQEHSDPIEASWPD
ncbi:hypothetical protein CR513_59915, partial [Mucuna pruriens]